MQKWKSVGTAGECPGPANGWPLQCSQNFPFSSENLTSWPDSVVFRTHLSLLLPTGPLRDEQKHLSSPSQRSPSHRTLQVPCPLAYCQEAPHSSCLQVFAHAGAFPTWPPGKLLLIHQDPTQISLLLPHLSQLFPPHPIPNFHIPFFLP